MEIDEDPGEQEEIEFEVEVPEPQNPGNNGQNIGPGPLQKKRRVVRKITVRQVFVEIIPDSRNAICILGCLAPDAVSRKTYAAPTNGHITKHVKANHPLLWSSFCDCKNNAASFRVLQETLVNLRSDCDKKIERNLKNRLKFTKVASSSLTQAVQSIFTSSVLEYCEPCESICLELSHLRFVFEINWVSTCA
jgi:hypothetical protein